MFNGKKTILIGLLATSSPGLATTGDATPGPWDVEIRSVTYAGSGCPAGSVAVNLSSDMASFVLYFDDFVAEVGPGISRRLSRKNCQINLDMDYPSNWTYALASGALQGYRSLEEGVRATIKANLYFQGSSHSKTLSANFWGPSDDEFYLQDELSASELVWAPCGARRSLNINLSARLSQGRARDASGILVLDYADAADVQLVWKRCY